MANRSSETDENTEDRHSAADPCDDADDSVEIVEVVGLDARPEAVESAEDLTSEEESDLPVPHSRRELYDMLLRKQAEFENARKRMDREMQESRQQGSKDLLRRLLPILDNFDRALAEAGGAAEGGFREGISLTMQQMKELLRREIPTCPKRWCARRARSCPGWAAKPSVRR